MAEFITATDLLNIYKSGSFPMAEHAGDDSFFIVTPKVRALLPIHDLHIPRSLQKIVRQQPFDMRIDTDFSGVIDACAERRENRPETWINSDIRSLFLELYDMGHAHSVECWKDERLVGGLYGLALGGTFCGESMFSQVANASKVALVCLCRQLDHAGFSLLDAQFHNPHLEQFGLYEIPQDQYVQLLKQHLGDSVMWPMAGPVIPPC